MQTQPQTTDMTAADLSSMRRLAEARRLVGLVKSQLRAPLSDSDAEACLVNYEDAIGMVVDAIDKVIAVYDSKLESAL